MDGWLGFNGNGAMESSLTLYFHLTVQAPHNMETGILMCARHVTWSDGWLDG